MQYKQNLHTHTSFCDGKDTPEEMIKKAIELGFNSIGFSGHAPMYYSEKYNFNNTDQYVQEIYRLKNVYKGIIDIYCGLEYDIYCGLDTSKFEYLIGSVHYLKKDEKFIPFDRSAQFVQDVIDQNFGGDGLKFARTYYEQVIKLPEYGKFDIVGHFDIITKNIEIANLFDVNSPKYKEYAIDALRELSKKIDIFEVNSGAMARGYRTKPYPQEFLLREMKALDCKIVISSDCHDKNYLDCGFDMMQEYVKFCGFKYMTVLKDGVFTQIKL